MSEWIAAQQQGGTLHLRIATRVNESNAAAVLDALVRYLDDSTKPIEFDVAGIGRQDMFALAVLLEWQRRCREAGCRSRWVNPSPDLLTGMAEVPAERTTVSDGLVVPSLPEQVGGKTLLLLGDLGDIVAYIGDLAQAVWQAVRHPRRVRWRDTFMYMDRCGTDALPIVVLICFLMGLILGFQAAIQLRAFGADIFVADLVGLSICKELGPLMVAMICTGRAGSAFAAEIGTMKVSEEIDALVTMGLEPSRFLVIPKLLALVAVMPLLTIFGDIAGVAGGFVVGIFQLNLPFIAYWNQTVRAIGAWDVLEGLIKSGVFAFLIAAVGCNRGLRTEGGAQGVGGSATSAVVSGIFLIIVADAVMTLVFTRIGLGQ